MGESIHTNNASNLSDFGGQRKKLKELAEKYKSIGVVTHFENIRAYSDIAPYNAEIITLSADKL